MQQDLLHRYIFEQRHVRGELVQLQDTFNEMISGHSYPQPVVQLLGELLVSTCLLTATLKFEGDIAVQIQGDGPLKYAAINGDNQQNMRGIARIHENIDFSGMTADIPSLVGKGYMVITITPEKGERYQGVVPLTANTLAGCLEDYFQQSEQLQTRIWIASDIHSEKVAAAGMLLQVLPVDKQKSEQDFEHLVALTNTIKDEELLTLDATTVLTRLYHEDNPQLFSPQAVQFKCTCSRKKTENALANVGYEELLKQVEEEGNIKVNCHYCLKEYQFDVSQIKTIFN